MSVSLNSSQKLFDFLQNYTTPAIYNFSTIPETKAFIQRVFEVFSDVYADPLSSCNLAAECVKGSSGCEAICKSSSLQAVKLHTNQTNNYLTIASASPYFGGFYFTFMTPSKPSIWLPSFFVEPPPVIMLYTQGCNWPVMDDMDVFGKEGVQTKSYLHKDLLNGNRDPDVEDVLFEDETINYFRSSLLNCSKNTKTQVSPSLNEPDNIGATHIQKMTDGMLHELNERKKRLYEKMYNISNQEVCPIQTPEKADSENKPNPSDPQTTTVDQPSTTTAQNVAQSSASTNQNGVPLTQTKKEEKQTPPDPQPANTDSAKEKDLDADKASAQPKPDETPEKRDSDADSAQNDVPLTQTKKEEKQTPPDTQPSDTASAKEKDLDADKASAQPKPDETPEKRDSNADSAKPNQNSSNHSQTNTGSSSNWLLGIGAIGGGVGLAGLYARHQSKKRQAQKEKEEKLVGAIKVRK